MTRSREDRTTSAGRFVVLLVGAFVMVLPFMTMLATSLKPQSFVLTPDLIPDEPTLRNYVRAWTSNGFARYFWNSTVVTVATVVGVLAFGSTMAYAFARFEFPGKKVLFYTLIGTLMIPGMMLIIPQFFVARDLQLLDSRSGLVAFYVAGQLAFTTFLLRGFFESIPRQLDEAMLIDGANRLQIYLFLMLPLAKPALATAAIFTFLGAWDEFVWAVTVIDSPANRTLPIAIQLFQGQHATSWGLVFAASTIAVVPVITVFLIFQRYFVSGLQSGALKG
ncbi:MAG: carbohydrate ABC transporter permease [Nocardioidaceae bacterium]